MTPTFSLCHQGFHAILPDGCSAVWTPKDNGFDATLRIFTAEDWEWIQPLLETHCPTIDAAKDAICKRYDDGTIASCLYANAVLATCEACDTDVAAEDICSETGDYRCEPCCECSYCNKQQLDAPTYSGV